MKILFGMSSCIFSETNSKYFVIINFKIQFSNVFMRERREKIIFFIAFLSTFMEFNTKSSYHM